jgi:hypothetical protein
MVEQVVIEGALGGGTVQRQCIALSSIVQGKGVDREQSFS